MNEFPWRCVGIMLDGWLKWDDNCFKCYNKNTRIDFKISEGLLINVKLHQHDKQSLSRKNHPNNRGLVASTNKPYCRMYSVPWIFIFHSPSCSYGSWSIESTVPLVPILRLFSSPRQSLDNLSLIGGLRVTWSAYGQLNGQHPPWLSLSGSNMKLNVILIWNINRFHSPDRYKINAWIAVVCMSDI